ncbi:MAG: hypothetical protein M3O22_05175, partial [Pseudomonadota bacterium]|nr:hypothetical protein [Pseudomonadota bacterium]
MSGTEQKPGITKTQEFGVFRRSLADLPRDPGAVAALVCFARWESGHANPNTLRLGAQALMLDPRRDKFDILEKAHRRLLEDGLHGILSRAAFREGVASGLHFCVTGTLPETLGMACASEIMTEDMQVLAHKAIAAGTVDMILAGRTEGLGQSLLYLADYPLARWAILQGLRTALYETGKIHGSGTAGYLRALMSDLSMVLF